MPAKPPPETEVRNKLQKLTRKGQTLPLGRAATGIWATLRVNGYAKRPILLPANTCYIILWAVLHSGNTPVLVDVDPNTANLSSATIERTKVENAAAIIPCHMYGLPAPMADITAWAKARSIFVIEDAALALGSSVDGRPAGAWGDVSVVSFGLGKIVDEQVGGALATDDAKLAAEIEKVLAELPLWDDALIDLTNQWNNLYWALHHYEDRNPRLLTLYPALFDIYRPLITYQLPSAEWEGLPESLHQLNGNLAHRHEMATLYDEHLRGLPVRTCRMPHRINIVAVSVTGCARDSVMSFLAYLWEHGIHDATRWYPSLRYMTSALVPEITQQPTPNADLLGASIFNLRLDLGVDARYVERTVNLITLL